MRSPTFTGMYVNTVPASVRCTPSTRMSRMVNGWIATAGSGRTSARSQARRESNDREIKISAGEQAIEVVVEREEREAEQQREPETLADLHRLCGDRAALHDFGEIIHHVPSI